MQAAKGRGLDCVAFRLRRVRPGDHFPSLASMTIPDYPPWRGGDGSGDSPRVLHRGVHVAKMVGSDIEWANTVEGLDADDRCTPAGWMLLAELPGLPRDDCRALRDPRAPQRFVLWPNERDLGRRFLPNGGCDYMDSGHLETASPEMRGARRHLAWWAGKQRIVRAAQVRANAKLPEGQRLRVAVRNSDGFSNSFGSHDNTLITRPALERIVRHPPTRGWLAAFQVSSIVLTGAGKVGSENGRAPCRYQISQRADSFERLISEETMFQRPIINTRDEAHCGPAPWPPFARYHCILHDANLSHVAHFLKIGTMQIALTMVEAGEIDPRLCLADPVSALIDFSHDPELRARAELEDGGSTTMLDLQARFLEAAERFVRAGRCEALVPEADAIVSLWAETLSMLERRDFAALTARLDWVHRLSLIEGVLAADSRLSWDSPALRLIDFAYGDITEGMFFESFDANIVKRLVTEEEILAAMHAPPEDTRAWTRARLLALAPPEKIVHVDWDSITFHGDGGRQGTVWLGDPLGLAKATSPIREASTFDDALEILRRAGAFAPVFQNTPTHATS